MKELVFVIVRRNCFSSDELCTFFCASLNRRTKRDIGPKKSSDSLLAFSPNFARQSR
jgi:hypothetical protein